MKRLSFYLFLTFALLSAHTAKADDKEAKAVRQMIVKVNDKWQKDHSAEVRAF
jgi:hypothetical protein